MKRPTTIGGRSLPAATGRCAYCRAYLGDPRESSMRLITAEGGGKSRFALVCRDETACQSRRGAAPPEEGRES